MSLVYYSHSISKKCLPLSLYIRHLISPAMIIVPKPNFFLALLPMAVLILSCSIEKQYAMRQKHKVYSFEQVNLNDLLKAYLSKGTNGVQTMEGIYAVSSLTTRKGKGVLSSTEKEKVTERKENYLQVAIIKDVKDLHREFIEIPIDKGLLPSYSIKGEFSQFTENSFAVYKRLEKRDNFSTYTFTFDKSYDILEGVRIENSGNYTYTHKLTYVKLYPKK